MNEANADASLLQVFHKVEELVQGGRLVAVIDECEDGRFFLFFGEPEFMIEL